MIPSYKERVTAEGTRKKYKYQQKEKKPFKDKKKLACKEKKQPILKIDNKSNITEKSKFTNTNLPEKQKD